MKFLKKCFICLVAFASFMSVSPIKANDENMLNEFLGVVENSTFFKDNEYRIEERFTLTSADTDFGKRYTAAYVLNSDENVNASLVIIGDENLNIIEALVVRAGSSVLTVEDLRKDNVTNVNARGPVYECVKFTCNQWKTDYSIVYDSFCGATIGTQCSAAIVFSPAAYLLCRAGVVIACSGIRENKVCTNYYEELSVCEL